MKLLLSIVCLVALSAGAVAHTNYVLLGDVARVLENNSDVNAARTKLVQAGYALHDNQLLELGQFTDANGNTVKKHMLIEIWEPKGAELGTGIRVRHPGTKLVTAIADVSAKRGIQIELVKLPTVE